MTVRATCPNCGRPLLSSGACVYCRPADPTRAAAVHALVAPPPNRARGVRLVVDLVLTLLALPFFVFSLVGLMLVVKRWGKPGLLDWITGAFFGLIAWAIIAAFVPSSALVYTLATVGLVSWILRGVLRLASPIHQRR